MKVIRLNEAPPYQASKHSGAYTMHLSSIRISVPMHLSG